MGIRFECPNGHRLNVKAFLAGKRGICPDCDAKFVIPEVSGGKAAVVDAAAESPEFETADAVALGEQATQAPPAAPNAALPTEIDQSLPDVWYVRPASGEQYGPANSELMQTWVAQGRVPEDSWVWRTGWDKWKIASDVLDTFQLNFQSTAEPSVATSDSIELEQEYDDSGPAPGSSFSIETRKLRASSRRERARKVTVALGTLILLLAAALVLVLWNQD